MSFLNKVPVGNIGLTISLSDRCLTNDPVSIFSHFTTILNVRLLKLEMARDQTALDKDLS